MRTGIFMKDNGKMIKLMVMDRILMLMELPMSENGKMTNNMEKESKHGQMVQNMKANIMKGRKMVKVL
jgi:hypothetical protein